MFLSILQSFWNLNDIINQDSRLLNIKGFEENANINVNICLIETLHVKMTMHDLQRQFKKSLSIQLFEEIVA